MLDAELASLYDVSVKRLNEQVRRNRERFPQDFMFQLSADEAASLRSHFATLKSGSQEEINLKSQIATSRSWGGRRTAPYAFTEQGVAMLSSVLRSPRAVRVNVEIMRAFVRLRRMLGSNADLARKVDALEAKYDTQFRVVFEAIRELMIPPEKVRRRIGFEVPRGEHARRSGS
jgi:hypothetical protein